MHHRPSIIATQQKHRNPNHRHRRDRCGSLHRHPKMHQRNCVIDAYAPPSHKSCKSHHTQFPKAPIVQQALCPALCNLTLADVGIKAKRPSRLSRPPSLHEVRHPNVDVPTRCNEGMKPYPQKNRSYRRNRDHGSHAPNSLGCRPAPCPAPSTPQIRLTNTKNVQPMHDGGAPSTT